MGEQVLAVALAPAIMLGPAVVVVWFILGQRRRARQARKSPLTGDLLRAPGHALRSQLEEARVDLGFDVMGLMVAPAFALGFLYVTNLVTGRAHPVAIKARDAKPLSAEQLQRVAHPVEQRCRNVKPFYRPIDDDAQQ